MPFSDEQLSRDAFLDARLHLHQPLQGYRAATDPVFLAAACPAQKGQSVLELGCGAGAASLCLGLRTGATLTGVEVQENYADLARRNASDNNIALDVTCADLAALPEPIKSQSFDHVIANPPYYGPGTLAQDEGRATALQEHTPLAEWLTVAMKRTKPKGWLTLIHLSERLGDILELLNSQASVIKILPLTAREGRSAKRVVLRVRKGRGSKITLCNPLILHEGGAHSADKDSFTPQAKAILRDGEALEF